MRAQIIKKKGNDKSINGYTFEPGDYVMTAAESPNCFWIQEKSKTPKATRAEFYARDWSGAPVPQCADKSAMKQWLYSLVKSGSIGKEYIGAHRVAKLPFPLEEFFDAQYEYVLELDSFQDAVINWRSQEGRRREEARGWGRAHGCGRAEGDSRAEYDAHGPA